LGDVIAHEIGHLLLPPPAHSANGIMRAFWSIHSAADTPPQRFTAD
jgi:hypothetical protein